MKGLTILKTKNSDYWYCRFLLYASILGKTKWKSLDYGKNIHNMFKTKSFSGTKRLSLTCSLHTLSLQVALSQSISLSILQSQLQVNNILLLA